MALDEDRRISRPGALTEPTLALPCADSSDGTPRSSSLSREEWKGALGRVRKAGRSWAPYIRLRDAREDDFERMDQNGGGYIDFREFCEWIEAAEKAAGTPAGIELGVNEPIEHPSVCLARVPYLHSRSSM